MDFSSADVEYNFSSLQVTYCDLTSIATLFFLSSGEENTIPADALSPINTAFPPKSASSDRASQTALFSPKKAVNVFPLRKLRSRLCTAGSNPHPIAIECLLQPQKNP
jgi:hypothetical protein